MVDNGSGLMARQPNRTPRWLAEELIQRCLDTFQLNMDVPRFTKEVWALEDIESSDFPVGVRQTGQAQLEAMGYYYLHPPKHARDEGCEEANVSTASSSSVSKLKQTTIDLTCTDPNDMWGISPQSDDPDYAICNLMSHPVTENEQFSVRHDFTLKYLKGLKKKPLSFKCRPEAILPHCVGEIKVNLDPSAVLVTHIASYYNTGRD